MDIISFLHRLSRLSYSFSCVLIAGAVCSIVVPSSAAPQVRTGSGLLAGTRSTVRGKDVDAFLGIPFAVPPVGNLRFRKPLPSPAWDGTYSATSKPTPCWQLDLRITEDAFLNYSSASEDCLYLNIWRPTAPCRNTESCGAKLPVLVFIHGGGFQWGDSALFFYDGSNFASMADVVFVTFNYRVGIFGFLSAESPELPGNMGLWDQNLALKWIQKNIEHFGGNPADVTVAGHSAGGISAGMHVVSPHSKGLVNRIIMQSGTPLAMVAISAYKAGGQFVNVASSLGCYDRWKGFDEQVSDTMACLRELSAPKIHETLKQESSFRQLFPPVTGDEFFPDDPLDAATWKKMSVKEIIMGTTLNESTVFFQNIRLVAPQLSNLLSSNYRLTITIALKTMFNFPLGAARDIVTAYFGNEEVHHDRESVISMFCELLGDAMFYCPTLYFADVASQQGADVYRYIFAHKASKSYFPAWMGVVHGSDLGYMLGSLPFMHDESKLTPPVGPKIREILKDQTYTVQEEDFMKELVNSWASFIRSGKPSVPVSNPEWRKHTSEDQQFVYLLPGNYSPSHELKKTQCELWRPYLIKENVTPAPKSTTTSVPPVKPPAPTKKPLYTQRPVTERTSSATSLKNHLIVIALLSVLSLFSVSRSV
ncbi:unnamed protein product [Ixodes hexagonus]